MPVKVLKRRRFFSTPRAHLAVSRQPVQHTILQHRHEFFEIAVILSGRGTHQTGEFRHPIGAGDVLVINNRRAHGYESNDHLNLVNILIGTEIIVRLRRRLRGEPAFRTLFNSPHRQRREYDSRLTLDAGQLAQVEQWIDRLEQELRRGDAAGLLAAESWLTLIVTLLVSQHGHRQRRESGANTRMGQLLGWLEKNCARPLTVSDMAKQAGTSERQFYRAFRQAVGATPVDYLNRARIRLAADLLADGDTRISEVAQASGFDDSNYFSRVFRQITKQTPRQFKKSYQTTFPCAAKKT